MSNELVLNLYNACQKKSATNVTLLNPRCNPTSNFSQLLRFVYSLMIFWVTVCSLLLIFNRYMPEASLDKSIFCKDESIVLE